MHLLITNDDGIHAAGILTLAKEAVRAGHSVVVCAPATQQSATGHRLTILDSMRVSEHKLDGSIPGFAIEGTPVDCVRLSPYLSEKPYDFCLSGINDGVNAGTGLFYSGTAAAAREATMCYLQSMAISIGYGADEGMRVRLARQALKVMDTLLENPMPRLTFANLNGPCLADDKVLPLKLCSVSQSYYLDRYEERVNPRGVRYFWIQAGEVIEPGEIGSDVILLNEGHDTLSFVGGFCSHNESFKTLFS